MDNLINHPVILFAFGAIVIIMLLLDLGIFNKKSHSITNKEAITWSLIWIGLSMLFSGFIYYLTKDQSGLEKFAQFQSAYWIEKALSVDNLFVFILIFSYFKIDRVLQQKVLLLGIIGAFIFRAIFIFVGFKLIKLSYLPAFDFAGFHFSGDVDSSVDFQTNTFLRINVIITIFGIFLITYLIFKFFKYLFLFIFIYVF